MTVRDLVKLIIIEDIDIWVDGEPCYKDYQIMEHGHKKIYAWALENEKLYIETSKDCEDDMTLDYLYYSCMSATKLRINKLSCEDSSIYKLIDIKFINVHDSYLEVRVDERYN